MDLCLKVLKESNKTKFDSYSVRNDVLIISHITFQDCRVRIFLRTRNWTIAGQWSYEKIVILSLKPRGHVRILIHRKWAIIMSWTILKGLFLSNLDLPQVDSVSAEGARDAREASECDRQQNRKRALRKSISNVACIVVMAHAEKILDLS